MAEYICGSGQLKVKTSKDGEPVTTRTVYKGQPVPEAAQWPENILKSHIRIGHILVKGEEERPGFRSRPSGPATASVKAPTPPQPAPAPASVSSAPPSSSGSGASGAGGAEAPSSSEGANLKAAQPGKNSRR